jgi:hypothetical protein
MRTALRCTGIFVDKYHVSRGRDMTEQASSTSYCEVCRLDVKQDTVLKRFGKLFCSQEHMEQYVKVRQREFGLDERHKRRRMRFGC